MLQVMTEANGRGGIVRKSMEHGVRTYVVSMIVTAMPNAAADWTAGVFDLARYGHRQRMQQLIKLVEHGVRHGIFLLISS